MRNAKDISRAVLAAVFGLLGATGASIAAARLGLVPHDALPVHIVITRQSIGVFAALAVATSLLLSWTYATWFDGLLRGPSIWRGAQFGMIGWFWIAAIVGLVTQSGWTHLTANTWLWLAVATSLPMLTFGTLVGLVYGLRRVHDAYTYGIGYGVPDRRSLG